MSQVDLECGVGGIHAGGGATDNLEDEEESSICFSDADDGSCDSQFYSTAEGEDSFDDYSLSCVSEAVEIVDGTRASSPAASSDVSVAIVENGVCEIKIYLGRAVVERQRHCRICHLSLLDGNGDESSSSEDGDGVAIELGCSCKGDLAAAHKNCAEAWFKIKGNQTCEICNTIARNIVSANDEEVMQQSIEMQRQASNSGVAAAAAAVGSSENRTCLNGHRFLNLLLACMVFAFVISWLFHFNIPS